jgi:hypothetical protein
MPKSSFATELFERLCANRTPQETFDELKRIAESQTAESDWLEFKSAEDWPSKDPQIKSQWSKALSAFANAEGGVLIWGICCERDASGVDVSRSILPVSGIEAFVSRLDQLRPDATDPPLQNVIVKAAPNPTMQDEGLIVCFIPESLFKPHRAEFSGHHFYVRIGSHSSPLRPGTLRQLFWSRGRSIVVPFVECELKPNRSFPGNYCFEFQVWLRNQGSQTARDLFVVVNRSPPGQMWPSKDWVPISGYGEKAAFETRRLLHPGAHLYFFGTEFSQINAESGNPGAKIKSGPMEVVFDFRIFATDQAPIHAICKFSKEEIEGKAPKTAQIIDDLEW